MHYDEEKRTKIGAILSSRKFRIPFVISSILTLDDKHEHQEAKILYLSPSAGWEQGNFLGAPRRSMTMSETNETVQTESVQLDDKTRKQSNDKAQDDDDNEVPEIILQPPSTSETEEEDNGETTETEVERDREDDVKQTYTSTKKQITNKEKRLSQEERNYNAMADQMDDRSKGTKEETLVDLDTEDSASASENKEPSSPKSPLAMYFDEQDDFPEPPDNLHRSNESDLIVFSDLSNKNDDIKRYEDDLWIPVTKPRTSSMESSGSNDFPPPPSPPTIQAMECTCEMVEPTETRQLAVESAGNSLFSDEESTKERPSPIVLTMSKNGPVKNATSVKRGNGNTSTAPQFSPRSYSESTGFQPTSNLNTSRSTAPKGANAQYLGSEKNTVRPVSTSGVHNQPLSSNGLKQRAGSEGYVSPPKAGSPPQHRNLRNNSKKSFDDFPPPPPSLLDDSDEQTSPWVPLLQRFQVDKDTAMVMESEDNRRTRPKTFAAQEQKSQKFRTYTPAPRPSVVEVKSENKKDKKNETCV